MVLLRAGNKFAPTLNIRVDELLTTVLRNHPNVEEIEIFHGARHKVTGCKEEFNIISYTEVIGNRKTTEKIQQYQGEMMRLTIRFSKVSL